MSTLVIVATRAMRLSQRERDMPTAFNESDAIIAREREKERERKKTIPPSSFLRRYCVSEGLGQWTVLAEDREKWHHQADAFVHEASSTMIFSGSPIPKRH
jgi:hypothetical protein